MSIFTTGLLTEENLPTPIEENDAGVVLKLDGTFRIFTTGTFDPIAPDPRRVNQASILGALAVALSIPQVMDILMQLSNDPNVVGDIPISTGLRH